jgi:sigma-B regulation protein RsbQ
MHSELIKKNNIKLIGEGEKILFFIHGYGCNQEMWRFITPSFIDNHKIVLIDLVGTGDSDIKAYDYLKYNTLDGYADDIIEICDSFSLQNSVLIGHSVGAMIATLAANKRPELFSKVIMIAPSPRYINETGYIGGFNQEDINEMIEILDYNYLGWSNNIASVITGENNSSEITTELSTSFCKNNPEIATHFAHVAFLGDNRKDIKKLKHKTLIIQSKVDTIAPIQVGEYLHKNIPFAELKIIDTIGHTPHLSYPEIIIDLIKQFI